MSIAEDRQVTVEGSAHACWFVQDRVVRVAWISVGAELIDLPNHPTLGECYPGVMPKALWERIRYEHNQTLPRYSSQPERE